MLPAIAACCRRRRRSPRAVADRRHRRARQLHRRARRPRRRARAGPGARRAAGRHHHDGRLAGRGTEPTTVSPSRPSTRISATGSALSQAMGRRSSPRPKRLAAKLGGQAVPHRRAAGRGLARNRCPMRLRSRPARSGRAGAARDGRRHRGVARPQPGRRACRGRSICAASTSPRPTARAARSNESSFVLQRIGALDLDRAARAASRRLRADGRAAMDAPGHGRAAGLAGGRRTDPADRWRGRRRRAVADRCGRGGAADHRRRGRHRRRPASARALLGSVVGRARGTARAQALPRSRRRQCARPARFIHRRASSKSADARTTTSAAPALPMRSSCVSLSLPADSHDMVIARRVRSPK